jgi:UTP--glucose-1-phosphate uridylyltransferase
MVPVVDKPSIQYVVEEAVRAGIEDILIITGRGKRSIEDHFDRAVELEASLAASGKHDELKEIRRLAELADIHYIRQGEALGLGHAVAVARRHVGDNPFVVMLGDDIMHERSRVLEGMLDAYADRGHSVIALMAVQPHEISAYGCVEADPVAERLVRLRSIVEKPAPEEAPSNLAVMGRYVFTPGIFDALERTTAGRGGEIQLTDAIGLLLADEPVYGYTFEHGRYDIGKKSDYLRATIELAADRDDLGPDLMAFLEEFVRTRNDRSGGA